MMSMMTVFIDFWQQHYPILSILVPAMTGLLLILLGNPGADDLATDKRLTWRRTLSLSSGLIGWLLALAMFIHAAQNHISIYQLGEWAAPFGIVLVADRLAALMIMLTYSLALPLLWFASCEWDLQGRYFHALWHFLLMGLCGAFLTGDLFNLFVFFEILLIASYVLLLHPHAKARFQLGVHYVAINLLASALFLIGLGLIYANVGSMNMVDVARIYPTLPFAPHQLTMVGALLLLMVFAIKAAIVPVGFWLPKTYAVASAPVAAVFALMTKVGIYAILRVMGTVFNDDATQHVMHLILLPIGMITMLYGAFGALAAQRLGRFIGFMLLFSMGTLVIGFALFNTAAWAGMLYYLIHSTLIIACMYLLAAWISAQRGELFTDYLKVSPMLKQHKVIAKIFLILAMMMVGLPPFAGFIAKIMILQATSIDAMQLLIIASVIIGSLIAMVAFVRVGLVLFWRAATPEDNPHHPLYAVYQALPSHAPRRLSITLSVLMMLLISYSIAAEPIYRYMHATARQLQDHTAYEKLVLTTDKTGQVISVQPFDASYVPRTTAPDPYRDYIPYIIAPHSQTHHSPAAVQNAASSADSSTTPSAPNQHDHQAKGATP